MQAFRTILKPPPYQLDLNYQDQLGSLGSCFAENISARLQNLKFEVLVNPFGILYNPVSITDAIQYMLAEKSYSEADLFEQEGKWHHFDFHGAFSGVSKEAALGKMNRSMEKAREALPKLSFMIITLGTAYVWWHKEQARGVANCHKVSASTFDRRLLSVDEIVQAMEQSLVALRQKNPSIRFLLTVSPVRHIRDGLAENQVSKAILRLAADQLTKTMEEVYYFPAYEIMMDDLRDYRFYNADMIHPTEVAIDYIWQVFQDLAFSHDTLEIMEQVRKIKKSLAHRPLYPNSQSHQNFKKVLFQQMEALEQNHAFLSFLSEKEELNIKL